MIHVELRAPRYVSFGNSALLKCDYDVKEDDLHKVEWFHNQMKVWQYVKGRTPPFRNYSIVGSVIDVSTIYVFVFIQIGITLVCLLFCEDTFRELLAVEKFSKGNYVHTVS